MARYREADHRIAARMVARNRARRALHAVPRARTIPGGAPRVLPLVPGGGLKVPPRSSGVSAPQVRRPAATIVSTVLACSPCTRKQLWALRIRVSNKSAPRPNDRLALVRPIGCPRHHAAKLPRQNRNILCLVASVGCRSTQPSRTMLPAESVFGRMCSAEWAIAPDYSLRRSARADAGGPQQARVARDESPPPALGPGELLSCCAKPSHRFFGRAPAAGRLQRRRPSSRMVGAVLASAASAGSRPSRGGRSSEPDRYRHERGNGSHQDGNVQPAHERGLAPGHNGVL